MTNKLIETVVAMNNNRNNLRSFKSLFEAFDTNEHGECDEVEHFKGGTELKEPTFKYKPGGDHGAHAEVKVWHHAGSKRNQTHMVISKSTMQSNGRYSYPHPEVPLSHIKQQVG